LKPGYIIKVVEREKEFKKGFFGEPRGAAFRGSEEMGEASRILLGSILKKNPGKGDREIGKQHCEGDLYK